MRLYGSRLATIATVTVSVADLWLHDSDPLLQLESINGIAVRVLASHLIMSVTQVEVLMGSVLYVHGPKEGGAGWAI